MQEKEIDIDQCMKEIAIKDENGVFFIRRSIEGTMTDLNFSDEFMFHRRANVYIKTCNVNITTQFEVGIFKRPRACRQVMFWDLATLYNKLGLSCYKGWPSKWVHDRSEAWGGCKDS